MLRLRQTAEGENTLAEVESRSGDRSGRSTIVDCGGRGSVGLSAAADSNPNLLSDELSLRATQCEAGRAGARRGGGRGRPPRGPGRDLSLSRPRGFEPRRHPGRSPSVAPGLRLSRSRTGARRGPARFRGRPSRISRRAVGTHSGSVRGQPVSGSPPGRWGLPISSTMPPTFVPGKARRRSPFTRPVSLPPGSTSPGATGTSPGRGCQMNGGAVRIWRSKQASFSSSDGGTGFSASRVRTGDRRAGRAFRRPSPGERGAVAAGGSPLDRASRRRGARGRIRSPQFNLFRKPRKDTTTRAALTLVWAATDRLRWTASGTWVDRDSSVDLGAARPDLEYRRTIASVGLSWVIR